MAGCGLIHFDVLSPLESLKMINTEGLLQMRTRLTWADDNSEKKGKTLVPSGFAVLGMIILVFIPVITDHACVHTSDHTDHTRDHSMIIILVFIPVSILVILLALDLELCLGNQVSVSCCQRDDN